jgi:hypothetical protein
VVDHVGMQVIASDRPFPGSSGRASVAVSFAVGGVLVGSAVALVVLVFGTGFLGTFTPTGRATTTQTLIGALAWTFALTAPAGFGLVGLQRLGFAIERARARRPRITPAVRLARAIGDDHVVATNLRLPDGSRIIPELVIGPFGVAVIEEMPPAEAVISRGVRTWEVRAGGGQLRMIENPMERASRDAGRIRSWIESDESDHVVKVFAAVVGTDPKVVRTPGCAVIGPDQVAGWLASLPPARSFDSIRRDRIVRLVRQAL